MNRAAIERSPSTLRSPGPASDPGAGRRRPGPAQFYGTFDNPAGSGWVALDISAALRNYQAGTNGH